MKAKHLIILIVLAALLGGLAFWTTRKGNKAIPAAEGMKVLPDLPLNDISKIIISSAGSTVTVAKANGIWSVAERYNYHANFDKLAETMRELSELKIGQVVNVSKDELGGLKLLSPSHAPDKTTKESPGNTGTLVELLDGRNRLLASLLIGKNFMRKPMSQSMIGFGGYPDGQYVRGPDGSVFLVSKNLNRLTENINTWLDDEFINVSPHDIQQITVTGPGRSTIKVIREQDSTMLSLADLGEDEETTYKVDKMARALEHLGFDDIASPDLTPEETGLNHPVVFTARTKDGQNYILRIGKVVSNESSNRYVRVTVNYEPTTEDLKSSTAKKPDKQADEKPAKDQATVSKSAKQKMSEKTRILNDKFSLWTYVIKSYRAESLLIPRKDLIKKKTINTN